MRQRNSKSSAAAGRGYDIDLAVMCLDDFLSDSQAKTCTICFVRPVFDTLKKNKQP